MNKIIKRIEGHQIVEYFETTAVIEFPSMPFKSEIHFALEKLAIEKNLKIAESSEIETYHIPPCPRYRRNRFEVIFFSRPELPDGILGEQIEFQIKNLET